jgi:topoisomerase-4 subunit A
LVRAIDDIRADQKVPGILEVRDESDKSGLRIVVDLDKAHSQSVIRNYLLKNTSLQISYAINVVAIVNRKPVQIDLLTYLDSYLNFYVDVTISTAK